MCRILHMGKFYSPDRGGIETVTQDLAEACANRRYNVSVICFGEGGSRILNSVSVRKSKIDFWINSQPFSMLYLWRVVKEAWRSDIIHVHYPNLLAVLGLFFVWRRPVVCHWHSDVEGFGLYMLVVRPLELFLCLRSSVIVATSHNYIQGSSALQRFRNKVKVIPLGVEVVKREIDFSEACQWADKKFGVLRDSPMVLFVGRHVPYKGLDILIRGIQKSRNGKLLIVGSGPETTTLKLYVAEAGLSDRIFFCGRLDEDELELAFARCEIFCLPSVSRAEAFGVVMVEALARGLVLLSSNMPNSGMNYVNQNGRTGLVFEKGNPEDLGQKIDFLLENPSVTEQLRTSGYIYFQQNLSRELTIRAWLELYADIMGA